MTNGGHFFKGPIFGVLQEPRSKQSAKAPKVVFSRGTQTIREGCECQFFFQSPTFIFYAPKVRHTCAGVRKRRQLFPECWKRLQEISNFLKIPAELKNDSRKQLTNPSACLANCWSPKYECWTLPFDIQIRILCESFTFM